MIKLFWQTIEDINNKEDGALKLDKYLKLLRCNNDKRYIVESKICECLIRLVLNGYTEQVLFFLVGAQSILTDISLDIKDIKKTLKSNKINDNYFFKKKLELSIIILFSLSTKKKDKEILSQIYLNIFGLSSHWKKFYNFLYRETIIGIPKTTYKTNEFKDLNPKIFCEPTLIGLPFKIKSIKSHNIKTALLKNAQIVKSSDIKEIYTGNDLIEEFSFANYLNLGSYAKEKKILSGHYLDLTSYFGLNNYSHIILDQIPRLHHLIIQAGDFKIDGILIDKNSPDFLINILNKYFSQYNLEYIQEGILYTVEVLTVSTPLSHPIGGINYELVNYINKFHNGYKTNIRNRIFIDRSIGRRGVINSEAVDNLLKKYHIEKIKLENMSWEEQIAIFQNAELIVAPHGAGLANTVFCKNIDCIIIELFSDYYGTPAFSVLCSNLGYKYYGIAEGFKDFKSDHNYKFKDITVPIKELENIFTIESVVF